MKARVASLACALWACGGPSLRGAIAVEEGKEPRAADGRAPWIPAECRDRAGALARVASEFWPARMGNREVLVERRAGYASIVVTNRLVVPPLHTVFQFVSDDGSGPALLHDVRFAQSAPARATLTVTDSFDERSVGRHRMAVLGPALVSCRLDSRETVE